MVKLFPDVAGWTLMLSILMRLPDPGEPSEPNEPRMLLLASLERLVSGLASNLKGLG